MIAHLIYIYIYIYSYFNCDNFKCLVFQLDMYSYFTNYFHLCYFVLISKNTHYYYYLQWGHKNLGGAHP